MAAWWAAIGTAAIWLSPGDRPPSWLGVAMATAPGGIDVVLIDPGLWKVSLWGAPAAAIAVHVTLAGWYVLRFGRVASAAGWSPRAARCQSTQPDWLPPPRRSMLTAIIWKQTRESGRIVLVGLAAILFVVAWAALASGVDNPVDVLEVFFGAMCYGGFIITLVAGIGVFDRDLSPPLNEFWRSRPIHPDLWYWIKYLTGLVLIRGNAGADHHSVLAAPAARQRAAVGQVGPRVDRHHVRGHVYAGGGHDRLVRVTIYAAVLSVAALCQLGGRVACHRDGSGDRREHEAVHSGHDCGCRRHGDASRLADRAPRLGLAALTARGGDGSGTAR